MRLRVHRRAKWRTRKSDFLVAGPSAIYARAGRALILPVEVRESISRSRGRPLPGDRTPPHYQIKPPRSDRPLLLETPVSFPFLASVDPQGRVAFLSPGVVVALKAMKPELIEEGRSTLGAKLRRRRRELG